MNLSIDFSLKYLKILRTFVWCSPNNENLITFSEDEDGVGNQRQNRSLWGEAGDFEKIELFPSRKKDDKDPRQVQFNIAQGHFLAMKNKAMQKGLPFDFREIRMVEYIVNKELYKKFNAKKKEFKRQGLPHEEVYAFHGTDSKNIDSILKDNLDPKRAPTNGRVHGQGCYFSEFPDISFSYGNGLLLFRTLPGNEFCGKSMNIPDEYQSKKVICGLGDANNYGDMLIIQNPDQFMPYFVYHFSEWSVQKTRQNFKKICDTLYLFVAIYNHFNKWNVQTLGQNFKWVMWYLGLIYDPLKCKVG